MTKDGGWRVVEGVTAGDGEGGIRGGKEVYMRGMRSRRRGDPEDCWIAMSREFLFVTF
jgi:hypothetical protein